jgi:hypothetical protein
VTPYNSTFNICQAKLFLETATNAADTKLDQVLRQHQTQKAFHYQQLYEMETSPRYNFFEIDACLQK